MRVIKFSLTFLVLSLITTTAWAENFDQLVVFGDSLSDSGNIYQGTFNSFPPSPPYGGIPGIHPQQFPGRFSDGRNWAEYLAEQLGVPLSIRGVTVLPGGTNYAQGGAVTGDTPASYVSTLGFMLTGGMPLGQQVDLYLSDLSNGLVQAPGQNSLFVIWAGSNDILIENDQINLVLSAWNVMNNIDKLIAVGGKHFLILNLPMIQATPAVANSVPSFSATQLSAKTVKKEVLLFNNYLRMFAFVLKVYNPKATFHLLDVYSVMRKVLAEPAAYGINNLKVPVIDEKKLLLEGQLVIQANPYSSFFFDSIHPTTIVHQILAKSAYAELSHN